MRYYKIKESVAESSVLDATEGRRRKNGGVKRSFGNSLVRKLLVLTERIIPGSLW